MKKLSQFDRSVEFIAKRIVAGKPVTSFEIQVKCGVHQPVAASAIKHFRDLNILVPGKGIAKRRPGSRGPLPVTYVTKEQAKEMNLQAKRPLHYTK